MDPSNFSGLLNADLPRNVGELIQYVHCVGWMGNSIPRFSERASPLRELLEAVYAKAGSRKKKFQRFAWTISDGTTCILKPFKDYNSNL